MSDEFNMKTLLAYDNNIQLYLDATPTVVEGDVKQWLDKTVEGLKKRPLS